MLVPDKVDRTTKDAVCAVLSQINDCPYCGDMLISLVYAAGANEEARNILREENLCSRGRGYACDAWSG